MEHCCPGCKIRTKCQPPVVPEAPANQPGITKPKFIPPSVDGVQIALEYLRSQPTRSVPPSPPQIAVPANQLGMTKPKFIPPQVDKVQIILEYLEKKPPLWLRSPPPSPPKVPEAPPNKPGITKPNPRFIPPAVEIDRELIVKSFFQTTKRQLTLEETLATLHHS